jgi:hypothetical protein
MMLPLHTLLGINIENFCLVVDNAKSPADPVSFRNKPSRSGGGSSNDSVKSRWSSVQPSGSHSIVGMLSSALRRKSGETSGRAVPPVRIPTRQSSFSSPTVEKREKKIEGSISCQLRIPVRQASPVKPRIAFP